MIRTLGDCGLLRQGDWDFESTKGTRDVVSNRQPKLFAGTLDDKKFNYITLQKTKCDGSWMDVYMFYLRKLLSVLTGDRKMR